MNFIQKTFGGLSIAYYTRHFIFGLLICGLLLLPTVSAGQGIPKNTIFLIILCQPLYPYSRFVYESVINYILGENTFFVNAILLLLTKLFTMLLCWFFAPLLHRSVWHICTSTIPNRKKICVRKTFSYLLPICKNKFLKITIWLIYLKKCRLKLSSDGIFYPNTKLNRPLPPEARPDARQSGRW